MIFDKSSHACFMLQYHLVLCIKYRRKIINDEMSQSLQDIFKNIDYQYKIQLIEWNHDLDHIHVLFKACPDSNLAKFISIYKSASSRIIKENYTFIKRNLWKDSFWSDSYCLLTTGGATVDIIEKYIQSQGKI